jgi:Putative Flp pilus-assembly TadE/G-like
MESTSRDRGAATTILLVGMALVLTAATLVLSRIAHAGDLRTRAQIAADAAALAAVAEIRDRAALTILAGLLPYATVYGPSSAGAAQRFARANGSTATAVYPSSLSLNGQTVTAKVRTNECQTRTDPGKLLGRIRCRPGDLTGQRGTATASAKVTFPVCTLVPTVGVVCNGRRVHTLSAARSLFTVRLVDGGLLGSVR